MIKFSKAQASIEIIIVIIFLILFIYVFSDLSEETSKSLEITKIKAQQNELSLSLNEFFKMQEDILGASTEKYNILDVNSSYLVPYFLIPSKKVDCNITVDSQKIEIITNYEGEQISSDLNINLLNDNFIFNGPYYCGQTIVCEDNGFKLECT